GTYEIPNTISDTHLTKDVQHIFQPGQVNIMRQPVRAAGFTQVYSHTLFYQPAPGCIKFLQLLAVPDESVVAIGSGPFWLRPILPVLHPIYFVMAYVSGDIAVNALIDAQGDQLRN